MAPTPHRMPSRWSPNKRKLASVMHSTEQPNKTTTTATEKGQKAYGEPIGEPTVSPTEKVTATKKEKSYQGNRTPNRNDRKKK